MGKAEWLDKFSKREFIYNSSKVQFITHYTDKYSYIDSVKIALEGGCKWIQLRMKEASLEEVRSIALIVQQMCAIKGAVFIIDDYVELVKEINADGVHLGKTDMPISEARAILGDSYIIGGTANTYEDIKRLCRDGADYIGCGPFRFTTTKKNLSPVLGLEGYSKISKKMLKENLTIPVVAIGGITVEDIPSILQTGVEGIALSGTVLQAQNPIEEMKKIIKNFKI